MPIASCGLDVLLWGLHSTMRLAPGIPSRFIWAARMESSMQKEGVYALYSIWACQRRFQDFAGCMWFGQCMETRSWCPSEIEKIIILINEQWHTFCRRPRNHDFLRLNSSLCRYLDRFVFPALAVDCLGQRLHFKWTDLSGYGAHGVKDDVVKRLDQIDESRIRSYDKNGENTNSIFMVRVWNSNPIFMVCVWKTYLILMVCVLYTISIFLVCVRHTT